MKNLLMTIILFLFFTGCNKVDLETPADDTKALSVASGLQEEMKWNEESDEYKDSYQKREELAKEIDEMYDLYFQIIDSAKPILVLSANLGTKTELLPPDEFFQAQIMPVKMMILKSYLAGLEQYINAELQEVDITTAKKN